MESAKVVVTGPEPGRRKSQRLKKPRQVGGEAEFRIADELRRSTLKKPNCASPATSAAVHQIRKIAVG